MADESGTGRWQQTGPQLSGYYEVRPSDSAWDIDTASGHRAPPPRLLFIDVPSGRFDAGAFGGNIADPLWEWRGPIEIPSALPADL